MVTNVSPSITASPLFTLMLVMVPEVSASMLFCIFMASRIDDGIACVHLVAHLHLDFVDGARQRGYHWLAGSCCSCVS